VTVEVGPEHARTTLVLGVTAQQINCLHVLGTQASAVPAGFAGAMQREQAAQAVVTAGGRADAP
jgi:flagellar protein FliO/FliZ